MKETIMKQNYMKQPQNRTDPFGIINNHKINEINSQTPLEKAFTVFAGSYIGPLL